jgi:hypothetical protein
MKTPILKSTNNPSLFVYNNEQRPIHPQHVQILANSIRKHGFFPSKPVQCYQAPNGKLIVVDGHHRLEAAKLLGESFYYVVETEQSQNAMPDVNRSRSWKSEDYVRQYSLRGYPDFILLSDYVKRGLPLQSAVNLLGGHTAGSNNLTASLKDGTFKVKTTAHADMILSLIEDNPNVAVFRHYGFVRAMSLLLWLPQFDFHIFKQRVEHNLHKIPNCSNVQDFLEAIEEVYNFRVPLKDRESLSLLAVQAAARRSAAGGKRFKN